LPSDQEAGDDEEDVDPHVAAGERQPGVAQHDQYDGDRTQALDVGPELPQPGLPGFRGRRRRLRGGDFLGGGHRAPTSTRPACSLARATSRIRWRRLRRVHRRRTAPPTTVTTQTIAMAVGFQWSPFRSRAFVASRVAPWLARTLSRTALWSKVLGRRI